MKKIGESIEIKEPSTPETDQDSGVDFTKLKLASKFEVVDNATHELWAQTEEFVKSMCEGGKPHSFTLIGPSGCGKTHLCREMFEFAYRNLYRGSQEGKFGETALKVRDIQFADWAMSLDRMRGGEYNLLDKLCNAWFLVLDDFGAETLTEWATGRLLQLINRRLGKWTIYNSNMEIKAIEELDQRIASRLFREGGKVLMSSAPDWNRR